MAELVVVSAFIPSEGKWDIKKISLEEAKELVNKAKKVSIYTQHQTIKLINLEPDTERRVYIPQGEEKQLWLKPNGRLEFGKEYSLEELQEIGVQPFLATPIIE